MHTLLNLVKKENQRIMTEREMEEIFKLYGHSQMYMTLKNKLLLSSLLDNESGELLESFFSSYDFRQGATMSYEEFAFHIRVFKLLEEQEVLPEVNC
ncbi:hypothetical protein FZC79_13910 [Rossellomorea vietnamensis]|uniref:Uncharacterized protein n=1 Tax=Rossellomorea vietnamensis TaxID=218284 RepID=A0A5D4KB06_9BACI|nr:hypothetical protein [Rossellomorea vietnamensis]TYR74567.1 hypothetical protein FZC79_13910 [Rossellomorea vietnamensis]